MNRLIAERLTQRKLKEGTTMDSIRDSQYGPYEDDEVEHIQRVAEEEYGPLTRFEYAGYEGGYELYRGRDEEGKGKWVAVKGDDIIPITYQQALGREPITQSAVGNLSKELGKRLLPQRGIEESEDTLDIEEDPEETEQQYTSADTSINSGKLPAIFHMVGFEKGSLNLDYGGGRFDNVAEYLESTYGATNLVYDKYNRDASHNKAVLDVVRKNGGADTVTCSNVLNVIAEERKEEKDKTKEQEV